MVVKRRRRKPKKGKPPVQPIPEHIQKGDSVVYMLQRIDYHHAILVDCVVTSSSAMKRFEQHLLDHFRSDSVRMEPRLSPPRPFSRAQIKFGVSRNLPKRLEDINDDIFDSGVTEWRALSWPSLIIAHRKFWWMRNRGWIWSLIFLLLAVLAGAIYVNT